REPGVCQEPDITSLRNFVDCVNENCPAKRRIAERGLRPGTNVLWFFFAQVRRASAAIPAYRPESVLVRCHPTSGEAACRWTATARAPFAAVHSRREAFVVSRAPPTLLRPDRDAFTAEDWTSI